VENSNQQEQQGRRKAATVGELRAALEGLDPSLPVAFLSDGGRCWESAENTDELWLEQDANGGKLAVLVGTGWSTELRFSSNDKEG
jgi:hypothetical protein